MKSYDDKADWLQALRALIARPQCAEIACTCADAPQQAIPITVTAPLPGGLTVRGVPAIRCGECGQEWIDVRLGALVEQGERFLADMTDLKDLIQMQG